VHEAGTQGLRGEWIPAFAGMTIGSKGLSHSTATNDHCITLCVDLSAFAGMTS